jgi:hypothetical protein
MQEDSHSYYIVNTDKYKYFLYITENNRAYSIQVGGLKQDCINLHLYDPRYILTKVNPIQYNSEYAQLPYLERKDLCAYNKFLEPSEGTHDILMTTFAFVKDTFKWVKYIEYTDSSKKNLPGTNEYVELYILYISIKGKTWYEYYYNSYLKSKELRDEYNKKINILKNDKMHIYFEELWKQAYKLSKYENDIYILNDNIILNAYNKSTTLLEFFNNIRQNVSQKEYFYMAKTWIKDIIITLIGTDFIMNRWVIPISSIKDYNYKLTYIKDKEKNTLINTRIKEIKQNINTDKIIKTNELNELIRRYNTKKQN